MTRKRQTHVREAGLQVMGILSRRPGGTPTGIIALMRSMDKSQTRQTLNRLVELEMASFTRRKGAGGKGTDFFELTDRGREYLNAVMVERAKPRPPEPDESEEPDDDVERRWPRKDPEETVRQAVRTQPNSVFDMARVMAC